MKSQTIRVLLIEDDEDYYFLTRQLFSQFGDGYDLEWVHSYNEGLQAASRGEHDVILVDYRLGEVNGVELIREMQKSGCRIPMILLTGQGDRTVDIEAMHAGAADYLVKHETTAALLERTLRFIVERRHIEEDLSRSEKAYRHLAQQQSSILNALPANIALVDSNGKIITVNEGWKKFAIDNDFAGNNCGSGSNYLAACEPRPESSNDDAALAISGIREVLSGAAGQFEMEYPCHSLLEQRWFRMLVKPLTENGADGAVVMHLDITEHALAEEKMRASENRYHRLFETARDGILILDHATRQITDANPFIVGLLGYSHDELVGKELWEIGLAKDEEASIAAFRALQETGYIRYEDLPLMTKDGKQREVEFISNGYEENGHQVIQCNIRDITDRKASEERIIHEAFHDLLTGLPNRALFIEHLNKAIAHAERHDNKLYALLFLDLDHFKTINDSVGHTTGDQFLVATARRLETTLRPEDVVARMGGDEFTILLNDIRSIHDAIRVANRVHDSLALPFHLNGRDVSTTTSIGIALSTPEYGGAEEVLRDADTAMYRAKTLGRGRHEIFNRSMHEKVVAQLKLETDLRLAVERKEFFLQYQPIMSLKNNRLRGFEALIRWRHPERGLVPPNEFIPTAEETGLILPIGNWVLYEACRQLRQWQNWWRGDRPLTMNVNLSAKQFSQVELVQQIASVLERTGLQAESLKLEITESAVMDQAEVATAMLWQLKELGVKLHIDDFGTGYSSLSYLHRFPVDELKIDGLFVSRMEADDESSQIVATIVQLAHNLGMEVTAEGVETVEQLAHLRALSCEYGQGYYFSGPVGAESAKLMIAA
ncbi:MAG: PAS domain S-box protein [Acidobacteria bacterium]|nr:MAG: PAS domain S-box protein [Acidobacteriota bacterium]